MQTVDHTTLVMPEHNRTMKYDKFVKQCQQIFPSTLSLSSVVLDYPGSYLIHTAPAKHFYTIYSIETLKIFTKNFKLDRNDFLDSLRELVKLGEVAYMSCDEVNRKITLNVIPLVSEIISSYEQYRMRDQRYIKNRDRNGGKNEGHSNFLKNTCKLHPNGNHSDSDYKNENLHYEQVEVTVPVKENDEKKSDNIVGTMDALIDCGARVCYMNEQCAKDLHIKTKKTSQTVVTGKSSFYNV
uniref:Peptidase A2 domain-containing protein n=1 Tax=Strongyloides stercoralis TaxID=6248 RepID=A0AAF5DI59_STRER